MVYNITLIHLLICLSIKNYLCFLVWSFLGRRTILYSRKHLLSHSQSSFVKYDVLFKRLGLKIFPVLLFIEYHHGRYKNKKMLFKESKYEAY